MPRGNPKGAGPVGDDDQPWTNERVFWWISKQHPGIMAIKTHKTFPWEQSSWDLCRGQITAGSCILPLHIALYTFTAYACGVAGVEKKPVHWIC